VPSGSEESELPVLDDDFTVEFERRLGHHRVEVNGRTGGAAEVAAGTDPEVDVTVAAVVVREPTVEIGALRIHANRELGDVVDGRVVVFGPDACDLLRFLTALDRRDRTVFDFHPNRLLKNADVEVRDRTVEDDGPVGAALDRRDVRLDVHQRGELARFVRDRGVSCRLGPQDRR